MGDSDESIEPAIATDLVFGFFMGANGTTNDTLSKQDRNEEPEIISPHVGPCVRPVIRVHIRTVFQRPPDCCNHPHIQYIPLLWR